MPSNKDTETTILHLIILTKDTQQNYLITFGTLKTTKQTLK